MNWEHGDLVLGHLTPYCEVLALNTTGANLSLHITFCFVNALQAVGLYDHSASLNGREA